MLGVLLVAIVGLRVEVLKLGSGVGTEIQQATALQSSNSALRAEISALSDNQRIATLAQGYGMHMPNPLDVHFVQASVGRHVQAAIHNISAPSGATFLTGLAAEQQASQQSNQAVAVMNGATPTTATGTGPSATPAAGATGASSVSPSGTGSVSTATGGGSITSGTDSSTGATAAGTVPASGAADTGTVSSGGATDSGAADSQTSGLAAGPSSASAGATGATGASTGSTPSQTTVTSGSTNGGTGLAG